MILLQSSELHSIIRKISSVNHRIYITFTERKHTLSNCIYLREPGILHDMMFAMKLRFNGERAFPESANGSGTTKLCRQAIDQLKDVSDKLLPLFYSSNELQIKTGLLAYMRMFLDEFDYMHDGLIERFYESLCNTDRLKQFIYRNYISGDCPEHMDFSEFARIREAVLNSVLPADVQLHMINFLFDGQNEIDLIIRELRKAQQFCEDLHRLNEDRIHTLISQFNDEKLSALGRMQMWDIRKSDPICHTYCVLHACSAYGETRDGAYLVYLGIDGDEVIRDFTEIGIDLYELGRILYDETRLKILDMLQKKPMYCAEIARELGLKNNSTLYHLNMMEKQKMLLLMHDGKKIYYRINSNYLSSLRTYIDTAMGNTVPGLLRE